MQKGLSGLVGRSIIFVPFALAEVGREHFKDQTAAAGQTDPEPVVCWSHSGCSTQSGTNVSERERDSAENEVNPRHAPELQPRKLSPRVINTFSALATIFLCASLFISASLSARRISEHHTFLANEKPRLVKQQRHCSRSIPTFTSVVK